MPKQFLHNLRSLALVVLLVSACQPTMAVTQIPTPEPSPIVSAIAVPTPLPTVTLVSTSVSAPTALWVFQAGAAIWSTPTVANETVYFGSDDGNLYAADAQDGKLRWQFATEGIVRSKPAIVGALVYFASDDGYLYAVTAQSGTLAWRTDIGNSLPRAKREKLGTSTYPTGWDYLQSSPLVVNGQIYVGSLDGNVYALSADHGAITWKFNTDGKVRATPTLADGVLYVGSWDQFVYALDGETGQLRWKTSIGGQLQTTALVANGIVYTASRKASVVALDAQTGEKKWEYDYGRNMWVESSPQLVGNIIYIGSSGYQPIVGLDSQTGKLVTAFFTTAFHWSTPAIARDTLYIGATSFKQDKVNRGGLLALKLVDGRFSDPNREYVFFAVPEREKAEGNWSGVAGSPVTQNGIVYFGGLDGNLYALQP